MIEETPLLSIGDSVLMDFSMNSRFRLDMTRDTTLMAPINVNNISLFATPICVSIYQPKDFPRKLNFHSCYKFINGITPTITKRKGAIDHLYITSLDRKIFTCTLIKDVTEGASL